MKCDGCQRELLGAYFSIKNDEEKLCSDCFDTWIDDESKWGDVE